MAKLKRGNLLSKNCDGPGRVGNLPDDFLNALLHIMTQVLTRNGRPSCQIMFFKMFPNTCLFVCLFACLFVCLFACLLVCLFACFLVCLFVSLLVSLLACLFVCLFACLLVCLFACLLACLFVCLLVCLFGCLFVCLFACLLVCLLVCLVVCLVVCLFACLVACLVACLFVCLPLFSCRWSGLTCCAGQFASTCHLHTGGIKIRVGFPASSSFRCSVRNPSLSEHMDESIFVSDLTVGGLHVEHLQDARSNF